MRVGHARLPGTTSSRPPASPAWVGWPRSDRLAVGPPCAIACGVRSRQPLARSSREPSPVALAIVRRESPATRPRESSSRSASDRRSAERSFTRRFSPPVSSQKPLDRLRRAAHRRRRRRERLTAPNQALNLRPVRLTQTPCVARPLTLHPGLPELVARIIAEMLRRSLETTPGLSCEAAPSLADARLRQLQSLVRQPPRSWSPISHVAGAGSERP